jgi:hypothetical protein
MSKERSIAHDEDAIAKALGTTRSLPVGGDLFNPVALLGLTHRFNERLRSTGGRPTDPKWTVTRRVPFAPETWEALNTIASRISSPGRKVAPAQVAAALIEDGIAELDKAAERAFGNRLTARETECQP